MTTQLDKIGEAAAKANADLRDQADRRSKFVPEFGYPNLPGALAAFQAGRPTLTKTNPVDVIKEGRKLYSYSYADLADVEEAVIPLLGAVGIAWHCHTEYSNGNLLLVCSLEHESGDLRSSVFPLQVKLTDAQGMGSYLTYFQRYALMMMTGVHAAGEDDDGQHSAGRQERFEDAVPRQQERPAQVRGTRQGAADDYAKELISAPLEELPKVWVNVEAGGHAGDKPTPAAAEAIRNHLAGAEFPPESEPGRQLPMATGPLAQIAVFRLIADGWTAAQFHVLSRAVAADAAYIELAKLQPNFGKIKLTNGQRLGDWLSDIAVTLTREANSDPQQNDAPPWVVDADPPYGKLDQAPDISTYDDAEDNDRPAVLEGT
jgi:hypothetical protein